MTFGCFTPLAAHAPSAGSLRPQADVQLAAVGGGEAELVRVLNELDSCSCERDGHRPKSLWKTNCYRGRPGGPYRPAQNALFGVAKADSDGLV